MRKKPDIIILGICSLFLIPLTGITLASHGPYLLKSVSRISSDTKRFGHIILFGNLIVFFILYAVYYLKEYHNIGGKFTFLAFFASCIFFELTFIAPYIPDESILLRKAHNVLAYLSITMLVVSLGLLIAHIANASRKIFKTIILCFLAIVAVAIVILRLTDTSALFEVTLVSLAANLMYLAVCLLYFAERRKEEGKPLIRYKIRKKKQFSFPAKENLDENITLARSNYIGNHVFIFAGKEKMYVSTDANNADKVNIQSGTWAVFYFDDLSDKTINDTRCNIYREFSNKKYNLAENIRLERYFSINKKRFLTGEIWIPVHKK